MIDIDRGIIVDALNNIMKIEKTVDGFKVIGDENEQKDHVEKNEITKTKTLTMKPNTIYTNNN